MKKTVIFILLCLFLAGCGKESAHLETATPTTEAPLQIRNPWKDYSSLVEAEEACDLDFPLDEIVADTYKAETYRVMNGELLEVTYRDNVFEVTVRMQAGEDLDISGIYAGYTDIHTFEEETHTVILKYIKDGGILQLISKDGYSYSFYAPNHYWGDSNADFLAFLNE